MLVGETASPIEKPRGEGTGILLYFSFFSTCLHVTNIKLLDFQGVVEANARWHTSVRTSCAGSEQTTVKPNARSGNATRNTSPLENQIALLKEKEAGYGENIKDLEDKLRVEAGYRANVENKLRLQAFERSMLEAGYRAKIEDLENKLREKDFERSKHDRTLQRQTGQPHALQAVQQTVQQGVQQYRQLWPGSNMYLEGGLVPLKSEKEWAPSVDVFPYSFGAWDGPVGFGQAIQTNTQSAWPLFQFSQNQPN